MPKIFLAVVLVTIFLGVGAYWFTQQAQRDVVSNITSYEECAAAGYPIMESYPEQCRTPDGRTFTRNVDRVVPPVAPDTSPTSFGQQVTITGEVTCLPHKDTSGPVTLECAFGIKEAATGNYYALRDPAMKFVTNLPTGEQATVTGALSEDPTSKYNIVGVIELTAVGQ